MKTIPLTRGQVALVDDDDFEWLSLFKWHAQRRPTGQFVAARETTLSRGKSLLLLMHRALLPGAPEVDHWNQNPLDNQRCNLRVATRSQNVANNGLRRDNLSGFKGVSWYKAGGKWRAEIRAKGRLYYLGLFEDIEEAARAYDAEAIKQFGEFACVNFPKETNNK